MYLSNYRPFMGLWSGVSIYDFLWICSYVKLSCDFQANMGQLTEISIVASLRLKALKYVRKQNDIKIRSQVQLFHSNGLLREPFKALNPL